MADTSKGKSPFYPGQPVPVELFVGRHDQIQRVMQRGAHQVALGKPVAMFVQGEYGIGKSSVASYVQRLAEAESGLHGIYASLAGCNSLQDVAAAVLEGTLQSGAGDLNRVEKVRNWLAKYVGTQQLPLGLTLNLEALKQDAPNLATPFALLGFLREVKNRLADTGVKGVFLVLDEINGIASEAQFAPFLKGVVDTNAMSAEPLPLLLMLCGVEERRREMIQVHQPVDRIFDIVDIEAMTEPEMREFFTRAFQSVGMSVADEAMGVLTHYSAGFPKIMHLIGDDAYWTDRDGIVDKADAMAAVMTAAEDVGRKYVDVQVYRALRSEDYRSILSKLAKTGLDLRFRKADVAKGLTESEQRKLNNFLQKLKKLNVIRSGDVQGEYAFNLRMVRLYLWLQSTSKAG